jgi:hypothetical protein
VDYAAAAAACPSAAAAAAAAAGKTFFKTTVRCLAACHFLDLLLQLFSPKICPKS